MSQQSCPLEKAFVLHTRPYTNTSLIVDFFCESTGRVSAIAKGGRRPKSPYRGLLQAFTPVMISWSGRSELKTLRSCEPYAPAYYLKSTGMLCGLYVNELLSRVLQRFDPHQALFQDYHRVLADLFVDENVEPILRRFEKALLQHAGYALNLTSEAYTQAPVTATGKYCFEAQGVKRLQADDDPQYFFHGKQLLAIADEAFDEPQVLRDAKRLFRLALAPLIGSKPIKSRELFVIE